MSESTHQRDEWYEQLLSISRQAFEQSAFEMAYHLLAAAMYCAKALGNLPMLRELLQEVERQRLQLDRPAPTYPLSSASASNRGHESSYSSLARQVSVLIRFWEMEDRLQQIKRQEGEDE